MQKISTMNPIKLLNDKTSIALNSQIALGFAFPPIIPLKGKSPVLKPGQAKLEETDIAILEPSKDSIKETGVVILGPSEDTIEETPASVLGSFMFQAKVDLRLENEPESAKFTLPFDPIISVSGQNKITRRYVAKSKTKGSIKELWSQDDYNISISGVLCGDENTGINEYINKLQKYCEAKESIHITNDILNNGFRINRIAIESYDFPFTKGLEYQSFSIKAYSDDACNLLG